MNVATAPAVKEKQSQPLNEKIDGLRKMVDDLQNGRVVERTSARTMELQLDGAIAALARAKNPYLDALDVLLPPRLRNGNTTEKVEEAQAQQRVDKKYGELRATLEDLQNGRVVAWDQRHVEAQLQEAGRFLMRAGNPHLD